MLARQGREGVVADLTRDVAYAARALRRAPAYTTVVVLTLTLGIGAASTAQSVIDPLLLRPLAYAQPDRLVIVTPACCRASTA